MNENNTLYNEVTVLLSQSLEGDLSAGQFEYFQNLLRENRQARECYYRLLTIHATLQEAESIVILQDGSSEVTDQAVWDALSMEEKTAPTIEVPPAEHTKEIISEIHREKIFHRPSKSTFVTFVLSTAAILLVGLFLKYAPVPESEVATLSSSINAAFAGNEVWPTGGRLSNRADSYWLQKGVIEVTFDYGAKVVVEAPAEFKLNSAENLTLHSGRLYAYVPGRSKGFMVETPNSRVIDLGTEFAVKVDFDGTSDLHMIKGKASLLPGDKGQTGQGQILTAGQARRVDLKGTVQTIELRETDFVRGFSSDQGILWRGQDVDLANIVGGGNGLETRRIQKSIDLATGDMSAWEIAERNNRSGTNQYLPVNASTFIDGVFVPDGGEGPIQVTSLGDRWEGPDTSNLFKYNIVNSLHIPVNLDEYRDYPLGVSPSKEDMILQKASEENTLLRPLGLMGSKTPPAMSDTSIFMHANSGISFDLDRIRELLPNVRISKFKSTFGIGEITNGSEKLDLWILVDGQQRFYRQNVDAAAVMDIDMELNDGDRFLSLVITDGQGRRYSYDWGLFMNPRLEVE